MLKERVFKVVSQVMNVPVTEVNEQSSPETLGNWDSLQHMNLILALEEEFKTKFSDEEIVAMVTVDIILGALQKRT